MEFSPFIRQACQACMGSHLWKLLRNYRSQLLGQKSEGICDAVVCDPTFPSLIQTFTSVCQGGFWFLIFLLKVPPLLCSCRHPHNLPVEVQERAGSKCGQNWVSLLYSTASHLKPCSPGDYQSCFSCLITVKPFLLAERGNVSFSACNDSCCHCTRTLCVSSSG